MNLLRQLNRPPLRSVLFSTFTRPGMDVKLKPPNILIYDGLDCETESFNQLKQALLASLQVNSYTIYHLTREKITTTPWQEHSKLLIVSEQIVPEEITDRILNFVFDKGCLLGLNTELDEKFMKTKYLEFSSVVLPGGYKVDISGSAMYTAPRNHQVNSILGRDEQSGAAVVSRTNYNNGVVVCSRLNLDYENSEHRTLLTKLLSEFELDLRTEDTPQLTPMFLFTSKTNKTLFLDALGTVRRTKLRFGVTDDEDAVPLLTNTVSDAFNAAEYWTNLRTSRLGKTMLFAEVTESTNDTLEELMCSMPDELGLTAVASCQVKGRGRSGNAWLSPQGSACFSFLLNIPVYSVLGQAIPCIQHIAALAIVRSVRNLPGYSNIPLKIKWPNDIYTEDGRKLGGILVKSSMFQRDILAVVGCGVNVKNDKPTICINELIRNHNEEFDDNLNEISIEFLIANALSNFEKLCLLFEENRQGFLQLYYESWLHCDQKITLRVGDVDEKVRILGLDECGFLLVRNADGEERSVHPDGNSFDMMHGLIYAK